MTQSVIPNSFELYLQNKLIANEPVNMNRIVLANIPNLDHTIPIDRNESLPPGEQIVHEQDIDQTGKVNTNAVVYSIVMDTTIGDFDFNAMYLIDKDERTAIGMIIHKETESKISANENDGTQGNSLVKSMLMEFDNASAATNIHVDASTWQIDYSARLKGMDEDIRIQALDTFGHDAFMGNGFLVNKAGSNQVLVNLGLSYIGGLRAELGFNQTLIIDVLPTNIYAVVNRQGTALSAFANTVEIQTSQTELDDYINGGVNYYVSKIATINADGSVTDERKTSLSDQQFASLQGQLDDLQQQIDDVDADLKGHKQADDPHPQYIQWDQLVGFKLTDSFAGVDRTAIALKGDGTEINRADFSKLLQFAIDNDLLVDQALINANPTKYAANYGTGDGVTTFTLPNFGLMPYEGAAGIYGSAGTTVEDAIQNISGEINASSPSSNTPLFSGSNGAFLSENGGAGASITGSGAERFRTVTFDASRVARTGTYTRPKTHFADVWIIHGEAA